MDIALVKSRIIGITIFAVGVTFASVLFLADKETLADDRPVELADEAYVLPEILATVQDSIYRKYGASLTDGEMHQLDCVQEYTRFSVQRCFSKDYNQNKIESDSSILRGTASYGSVAVGDETYQLFGVPEDNSFIIKATQ